MIIKLFDFMIHSGAPFYESIGFFGIFIVLCIAFVTYSFNASKENGGLVVSSLFLIMVASVAFVWGSMELMGNKWRDVSSPLFGYWAPFATVIGMYLCAFSLIVVTLGYNYRMKSSKKIMSLRPRDRHDFLGTNSSWLLLRLATYHFMIPSGVIGITLGHKMFDTQGQEGTSLLIKLEFLTVSVLPFIIGVFISWRFIMKLNLWSYSWKIPETPDYKVSKE